jgi:hypothetical protein
MLRIRIATLLFPTILLLRGALDVAVAADPWPGALPGTEIGQGLPAGYEPSGGAWHRRLNKFLTVSDGGIVSMMNFDGTGITNWTVPGDLEGIAVADPASDFIYIGVENPDSIREFNIVTGQVTRTFDLTPWMQGPDNSGLEALEFIPDAAHPEGGVFYAGLQADGKIYKFNLPILSSTTATTVTFLGTITPVAGRADISGLDYDRDNQILYAVFDSANALRAMQVDGTFVAEWDLPGNDQEGIAVRACDLFIAEDSGKVWRYDFPVDRRDDDADGVTNCLDLCPGTPAGTPVDATGCTIVPVCASNADCTDGNFCNGTEACIADHCAAGAPPNCDDGVGCTTDSCSDASAACVYTPVPALCDDGNVCTTDACIPETGCTHSASDTDGDGVSDCTDVCPTVPDPLQADFDGDGRGDACEAGTALLDADGSGRVDGFDLARLGRAMGTICGQPGYDAHVDFDRNCAIDLQDLALLHAGFGQDATDPESP